MPALVYKYGARSSQDSALLDQMRLGRRYYNALVEAENDRRRAAWGGDHPPAPDDPHETCVCDECVQEPNPEHTSCRCKTCKAHWKAVRQRVLDTPPLDVKPLYAEARAQGLHWGTCLAIGQAFSAAWTKTSALRTVRFRSWRQGDVAAVQIQLTNKPDSLVRLCKAPDARTGRRARNGLGRHTVQIRIGSNADRSPIFCDPIRIEKHRELSGRIAWVHVRRKRIADREVWSVAFTCNEANARTDEAHEGVVAVDVSWRKLPDGSWRLGYAQDDAGNVSELLLPPEWAERAERAERIRSHRDARLNELKAKMPLLAHTKSCRKAVEKLLRLGVLPLELSEWIARDTHLWQYETGCWRRSASRRRAALQEWVRMLRQTYAIVIVKDSQHKLMKEKHDLPQPAQRQGQHAAPGETVENLRRVFGMTGMKVVSAVDTTTTCVQCGHVTPINGQRFVHCERCGDRRDRDHASTRNMLQLYKAGAYRSPTARKTTSRFAKKHTKKDVPPKC